MKLEKIYQLGWISGRLEIEVIHAKPIFDNVYALCICKVMYRSSHIRINGVCKDKNAIIMEVGVYEGKHNLKISRRTFVPLKNIRR